MPLNGIDKEQRNREIEKKKIEILIRKQFYLIKFVVFATFFYFSMN